MWQSQWKKSHKKINKEKVQRAEVMTGADLKGQSQSNPRDNRNICFSLAKFYLYTIESQQKAYQCGRTL